MVKLNLLPPKVRDAEVLRLIGFGGVGVYVLALLMLGWRYTVAAQVRSGVEAKIAKVEAELKPLQPIADEVKKLSDEKTEQDGKKAKLGELTRRQAYLVRALDVLPDFMQGGQVWLNHLESVEDKTGNRRLLLDGTALTPEGWADFYNSLEAQSMVSELRVEGDPVMVLKLGRQVFNFKVSFLLKDPQ